ncbi:hypothetical protein H6F95_06130 [Cyanobacteria bacterium FACHB-471]|nr:hypothetical protein [Cyanobacteria bacterium FACHB-471]
MADIDNKLGAARNLGILNASSIRRSDRVGRTDLDDLRRFRLGERRSLNLSLSRITRGANVDVEVYAAKPPLNQVLGSIGGKDFRRLSATERNDNLQLVAASRQSGNQDEALTIASLNPGVYFVRVLRQTGDTPYLLSLADAPVDTSAPTARLRATAPTRGSSTHNFTVTYRDNVAVDVSSLDNRDILVTGPDGFRQSARRIAVNSSSNGATRSATYQLRAPGEAWDSTDNGIYNIFLRSNQVKDTSSNFAASGLLGSFQTNIVDLPSTDRNPPTASLNATRLNQEGRSTYDFTVTYRDANDIAISTINSANIVVTGPRGFNQSATYVGSSNGTSTRSVTYRVTAPTGTWSLSENGTYEVKLQPNEVSDVYGNFARASTLGTFQVAAPIRRLDFSGSSNSPQSKDYTFDIDFSTGLVSQFGLTILPDGSGNPGADRLTLAPAQIRFSNDINGFISNFLPGTDYYERSRYGDYADFLDDAQWVFSSRFNNFTGSMTYSYNTLIFAVKTSRSDYANPLSLLSEALDGEDPNISVSVLFTNDYMSNDLELTAGPTATFDFLNSPISGSSTYDFSVTYNDNSTIDVSSLDDNDIRVEGPNDFKQFPKLISVDNNADGSPRKATYRITAPGGIWDVSDEGNYELYLEDGQVKDVLGNHGTYEFATFEYSEPDVHSLLQSESL